MKIYEIGTGYTPIPARTGAATEIVAEELLRAFRNQNADAELIDIQSEDRENSGFPVTEVPVPKCFAGTDVKLGLAHKLKRVVYSVSLARVLKKLLRQTDEPVLLHFHNQYNLYFFLKLVPEGLRRKCLVAYTVHSYVWSGSWADIEAAVRRRYFQEAECVRRADMVFVLNGQTRQNLICRLGVPADCVHLVDNGVNTDIYSIQPDRDPGKTFIQVGSVCRRKNQLEAVRLLLPLMRQDPQIRFRYAGGIIEPDHQEEILRYCRENGIETQVEYAGEIVPGAALNEFYNSAVAMVFPSRAEGFSLVILEAMAAGVPVLIRRDLRFRLENQCIRYTDETFASAVKRRILDPQEREFLSRLGRQTVVSSYSWERIAGDYLEVFRREAASWQKS